jgi:ABC-2 type transport system ATP-binding protein
MDEAERCHKLAYISYGKLMTQGTAAEIVAGEKLSSWIVSGGDLGAIGEALRGKPGVLQTAIFGSELHVTGTDAAALEATLRREAEVNGLRIRRGEVGLEDVFINLMSRSADNFGPPS